MKVKARKERLYDRVVLLARCEFWVVGGGLFNSACRCLSADREVEAWKWQGDRFYFWMKVRQHSWRHPEKKSRARRILCVTRNLDAVRPLTLTECIARLGRLPEFQEAS